MHTIRRHAVFTLVGAIATSFGSAAAQQADPPATVRPEDARGWEEPPAESRVLVLGTIGRGLRATARFAVDVVTAPIRGAVWLEDHHRAFSRTRDLFYNADHTAGVVPTFSLETGLGGSIGARAFHDDLLGNREHVSLGASYGGGNRYSTQVKLELPRLFQDHAYLTARGRYEATDNSLFAGIGNPMDGGLAPNGATRFGQRRWLATTSVGWQHATEGARLRIGATYIYNDRDFDQDVASGARPIGEVYDTAMLTGFDRGIRVHEVTGDVDLDLRDRAAGNGIRITGFGGRGFGERSGFTHWGGEAMAYVTPWRAGRVFLVRIAHEGVDGDVPFTELPRLGGPGLLRGYRRDQFRDELSAIGTLEYRYPVHRYVSGSLFVETGKVARNYDDLTNPDLDDWHFGFGGGLVVHTRDSIALTLQIAYGDGTQVFATTDVLDAFRGRGGDL